jgi:hypothetical protein
MIESRCEESAEGSSYLSDQMILNPRRSWVASRLAALTRLGNDEV